jgi:hypothetical protein
MTWIHPLSPDVDETADVLGGKAHGLVVLQRLGLPVPPGFVISPRHAAPSSAPGGCPMASMQSWRPPSPISKPPPGVPSADRSGRWQCRSVPAAVCRCPA